MSRAIGRKSSWNLKGKDYVWIVVCYGWIRFPLQSYVEVLTTVPQNMTIFEDDVFKEVIKLKMQWLGWALIQCNPYLCKRTLGHRCRVRPSGDTARRPSASQGRVSEETSPTDDTLISDFWLPKLWDNKFLLYKPLNLHYLAMGVLAN